MKTLALFVAALACAFAGYTAPAGDGDGDGLPTDVLDLYSMSLAELMEMEVKTASLVEIKKSNIPVSATTITAADIMLTPYGSLLDLMEVYVPGFMYTVHSEGSMMGIRGMISDRNHKYLIVVNGYSLTQKLHAGVISEIGSIDLNDVEKIEIIRGPGSVTFGPGAMAGVISITTKNADSKFSKAANGTFSIIGDKPSDQNAFRASGQYSFKTETFGVYAFMSVADQNGGPGEQFTTKQVNKSGTGDKAVAANALFGEYKTLNNTESSNLRHNFLGRPLLKGQFEANYKKTKISARYSETSTGLPLSPINSVQNGLDDKGKPTYEDESMNGQQSQQLSASLSTSIPLMGDKITINPRINAYSLNSFVRPARSRGGQFTYTAADPQEIKDRLEDPRDPIYFAHINAENELQGQLIANFKPNDKYSFAGGGEFTVDKVGPAWGYSSDEMRMGDGSNFISNRQTSIYGKYASKIGMNATQLSKTIEIGDGWSVNTLSFLGEGNMKFSRYAQVLASVRADKNEFSDWLISPRLAIVSEITDKDIVKLIAQSSSRFSTGEQMYAYNLADKKGETESLRGFELIYNRIQSDNFTISTALFYNVNKLIGWDNASLTSRMIADQNLGGAELDIKYQNEKMTIGANHAFVHQFYYDLYSGYLSSGYSVAQIDDMPVDLAPFTGVKDKMVLKGTGNSIATMSENVTKLYAQANLLDKKLQLTLNTRVYWGYEGGKNKLIMYENAAKGTSAEQLINKMIADVRAENVFETSMTVNASATYWIISDLALTVSGMNLLGINNYRYRHDWGRYNQIPAFVEYYKEPMILSANLKFQM